MEETSAIQDGYKVDQTITSDKKGSQTAQMTDGSAIVKPLDKI